ncbi:DUF5990 family protein [Streptomyces sp. NPDC088354]|uniref:DUF5990 family protein n=1 Tax=unclassified Streptomyces TaxID=2593676 RepID=UPI0029B116B3|nr:DUF5990 family protein [Streptomyces sp. MI02-7b]MDX3078573.1 DUF5990 family protein [Streptomyces sp. MI02-7b]
MRIRIEGHELPGRTQACGPEDSVYTDVHVAVQRRNRPAELLDLQPADAAAVTWTLECVAAVTPEGVDVRGPYVQGGPGGRFVHVSWGALDGAGGFTMFRRAKLMLGAVDRDVLEESVRSGLLVGRVALTDGEGHPLCAAVRPPRIAWSAGRAGSAG